MAKTPVGTIATAGLDKLTKGDFLDTKKLGCQQAGEGIAEIHHQEAPSGAGRLI